MGAHSAERKRSRQTLAGKSVKESLTSYRRNDGPFKRDHLIRAVKNSLIRTSSLAILAGGVGWVFAHGREVSIIVGHPDHCDTLELEHKDRDPVAVVNGPPNAFYDKVEIAIRSRHDDKSKKIPLTAVRWKGSEKELPDDAAVVLFPMKKGKGPDPFELGTSILPITYKNDFGVDVLPGNPQGTYEGRKLYVGVGHLKQRSPEVKEMEGFMHLGSGLFFKPFDDPSAQMIYDPKKGLVVDLSMATFVADDPDRDRICGPKEIKELWNAKSPPAGNYFGIGS